MKKKTHTLLKFSCSTFSTPFIHFFSWPQIKSFITQDYRQLKEIPLKIIKQDHRQRQRNLQLCHYHINDRPLWIVINEIANEMVTIVIETNWYESVNVNVIVATWATIIQAFLHRDVHHASERVHVLNGSDIRTVGDRVAQHSVQAPDKV